MSGYNVAVAGATGAVGEALLSILAQRNFPVDEIFPLAGERSAGSTVMFNNKPVKVQNLADFDFSQAQIGLFSAGGSVSAEFAPRAADAGCVVID
ncbi:MAG TPA: aspartate-semialdehyde dehydrogenase, partial [Gammaproteobacteria bacterium]|nr:aspartate-semialdehyde dehydrogenase [Gammaproteobacteria bacterium]